MVKIFFRIHLELLRSSFELIINFILVRNTKFVESKSLIMILPFYFKNVEKTYKILFELTFQNVESFMYKSLPL